MRQKKIWGIIKTTKGGKGSGNFGHAGRPGEVGGSMPFGISYNWVSLKDVKKKLLVNGKPASEEWAKKVKKLLDKQSDCGRIVLKNVKQINIYSKDGDSKTADEFDGFYSREIKDRVERARASYEEYEKAKENGQEKNLPTEVIDAALGYEWVLKDVPGRDKDDCDAKIRKSFKQYPKNFGGIAGFVTVDNEIFLKVSRDNKCFSEEVAFEPISRKLISREKEGGKYFLDFDDVFTHESGHIIHLVNPKRWDNHYRYESFDRSTPYSKTNSREGFAETYVAYIKSGRYIGLGSDMQAEFSTIAQTVEELK